MGSDFFVEKDKAVADCVDRLFAAMAARLGLPSATGGEASANFVGRLKS
jgi:hypothetical protein